MDAITLSRLIAELGSQLEEIENCYGRVEERAAELDTSRPGTLEALAYQLHNVYNATEDLLKIAAVAFENHVDDASTWHRGIVHQLSLDIEGVRPPLVSQELMPSLDELRRFRHFFRHSYGGTLDAQRVALVLESARSARALIGRDGEAFLGHLRGLRDSMLS